LVVATVVWPTLAFGYALSQRPAYRTDPGPLFSLMPAVAGSKRIAVDTSLVNRKQRNIYTALFGPQAAVVAREPWRDDNRARYQAYVQPGQLPVEFAAGKGLKLFRSQGVVAWVGKLDVAPFSTDTFARLLQAGPLTFEAEEGSSEFEETLTTLDGQVVRHLAKFNSDRYKPTVSELATVRTPKLPVGSYQVSVKLMSRCDKRRGGPAGEVRFAFGRNTQTQQIDCAKSGWFSLKQRLVATEVEALRVDVRFRAGELWADKIVVERAK
jgi:hypothetical protein